MKRLGRICLILLLIAAGVMAVLNLDSLIAHLSSITCGLAGEEPAPIDLVEERPAADNGTGSLAELEKVDLKSLARQITAASGNDYARLAAIYDWVTANIAYDLEKAKNMESYGSGAEYLLKSRKGVCHDYAELTRALLKAVGVDATYEKGEVHLAPGKTERHAWNHVRIGETWYGLDTTWGAGFVDEGKGIFVQRPSRLYLTTPEELAKLHDDPVYKEDREIKWQLEQARRAEPAYLPDHEAGLLALFNESRTSAGLVPFTEEIRLLAAARQSAADAAERACRGEEYSLDALKAELNRKAAELRFTKAGMNLFTFWDYPTPEAEELYDLLVAEIPASLDNAEFQSMTVGVIHRGDLITVTLIYLSY